MKGLLRYASLAAIGVGAVVMAFGAMSPARGEASSTGAPHGYVFTHFAFALARDAAESGACPNGMTQGYSGTHVAFLGHPDLARRDGETDEQYVRRSFGAAMADPNMQNLCANPELGHPDPNFKTVSGASIAADGIDLDGQDSHANGRPAAGTCAHDDFRGTHGERGIDNQMYRLVGCSNSYQSTGQSNTFEIVMYAGEFGILMTLDGVDDMRNDNDVTVGLYANADPLELSPTRQALPNATYAMDQDPRFRTTAHGRIVNGVLTTDPVDARFHWVVNSIRLERPLDEARVRATISPDGTIDGILAGYTPVEALYDMAYGFRNGKDGSGNPAPARLRNISSIGQAAVLGHTCEGAYFAMQALADGHRDPTTGRCSAISTQYHFTAIPAFVVDQATSSVNSGLDPTRSSDGGQPQQPRY